jgi:predicted P-loop ATPase
VPRLDSWLVKWAKVDDTGAEEFVSLVGRRFMVGAVARALQPGCKLDTVLAVEGAGGGGKSTMFQVLADAVASGLFTDGVHDVSSTSAVVEATGGRWIVEIAELAGVRRSADIEALKAALTRTRDTHRRPYDVMPREVLRRFVFVATTNRSEYLNDPSGALLRRFWPVRTRATEREPIDLRGLADVAPQLWAEAVALYLRGEVWHLEAEDGPAYTQWTKGREQRRESLAWEDELADYLAEWVQDYFAGEAKGREMRDIARAIGDMRTVEGDNVARLRLADSLRAMGLEVTKSGGKRAAIPPLKGLD